MKRVLFIFAIFLQISSLQAQTIKEFSQDTGLYVSQLVQFTGMSLETAEVPDFERFLHLYDSLSFEQRMEIIEISNLMLSRNCRPRPHFIKYQQAMMEFFYEDKISHGYEEWLEGFSLLLKSDAGLLRTINQWLSLSLSLLRENIFYKSNRRNG